MTDTTFTLDAAFDRPLFWEQGGSVRNLVAWLRASRLKHLHRPDRSPLNLALVIDASGSMRGAKLAAAREAAMGARHVGEEFSSRSRKEMMLHEALTTESRSDKRGLGKPAWSARIDQRS
jgi:hypothetical protein